MESSGIPLIYLARKGSTREDETPSRTGDISFAMLHIGLTHPVDFIFDSMLERKGNRLKLLPSNSWIDILRPPLLRSCYGSYRSPLLPFLLTRLRPLLYINLYFSCCQTYIVEKQNIAKSVDKATKAP